VRATLSRRARVAMSVAVLSNRSLQAKSSRNIPSRESDESSLIEVVTIRDPRHPLFGRTFYVIRSVQRGGNFPISYEVQYRDGTSLLVPVAVTEPQDGVENRTKLSVEALHDLTSLVEQLEPDADRSEGPLGHVASGTAAPNHRGGRRSAGGSKP
jgi:hypothetical protein